MKSALVVTPEKVERLAQHLEQLAQKVRERAPKHAEVSVQADPLDRDALDSGLDIPVTWQHASVDIRW